MIPPAIQKKLRRLRMDDLCAFSTVGHRGGGLTRIGKFLLKRWIRSELNK